MGESILTAVIAVGVIGLILGIILAIASKFFAVKADEKIEEIKLILPGVNCSACGFASCEALAESIAEGKSSYDACPVGGSETAKKIGLLFGVEAGQGKRKIARVMCSGTLKHAKKSYEYQGIETCEALNSLYKGENVCKYGCLGLGDCVRACPFDAIYVEEGIAIIDDNKCKSCEKCVVACPKGIIRMVPEDSFVTVACSNKDKVKEAIYACKRGCIACQKCVRACPADAITVEDFLAVIDPEKCINCEKCIGECPVKVIFKYDKQ